MRMICRLFVLVLFLTLSAVSFFAEDSCKCATEVLEAVGKLKPGETRAALDTVFEEEGGWQVAADTRYVYKKCPYIKINVEFAGHEINKRSPLPTDKIVKVSKPYLDYSIKD